ncbi:chromate transporter [Falsiroseomonas bella]|uniref:Chromate transporter n=1 Tax=Falsiroseomonas bella TaxID=2184016 RepID=A0A317FAR1_9PROT|nr:chromate transporter [Falsiroseomonas bella]PWS36154.1 chromate transporter [Falsiroseomonas bella]
MGGVLLSLLLTFGTLSLLAVGGANAVVPEMHRQIVEIHGWLDSATFAQVYALAQAAPGPNILVAAALGWVIAGPAGMGAAFLGIVAPAWGLAWWVAGVTERLAAKPWLKAVRAGLVPIAIGLILASGLIMAQAAAAQLVGLAVAVVAALLVWRTELNLLWVLAAGGVAGLAFL